MIGLEQALWMLGAAALIGLWMIVFLPNRNRAKFWAYGERWCRSNKMAARTREAVLEESIT